MNLIIRMMCCGFVLLCLGAIAYVSPNEIMADNVVTGKTKVPIKPQRKTAIAEEIKAEQKTESEQVTLPEDTSPRLAVKQLRISGNSLIPTEQLLKDLPVIYNTSDQPIHQAETGDLYDFSILHDIIQYPGQPREVSRRTLQGFTRYILSVYHDNDYAGIYIYISAKVVEDGIELKDGILPVEVVEAKVSEITVTPYDTQRNEKEKGILRDSVIQDWSPVEIGHVVNKKKLDDFVDLLNINPDRYVAAVISRGSEPDTLALGYDVYEANPWHYYIQLDNAGTKERQWAPRYGVINTNFTGIDDRITAIYQAPLESDFDDNYSMFGSYEFPLFTPRLRLNLYGGRSEFDTSGGVGIDFLGKGSFYGGILRFNAFQMQNWFFDIISSLSHESSKVSPSLFLGSDVDIDTWGIGIDLYHSDDMSNTFFGFNRLQSIGGSPQRRFWDPTTPTGARPNSDRHFSINTITAGHSRYLDPGKVHRLSGSFRRITSSERLAPSKMTVFGGLYSVRGYKEDEIIADGGTFLSAQYEFDLIQHSQQQDSSETDSEKTAQLPWFSKLVLLAFTDFARANTKNHVVGEKGVHKLCSIGLGTAAAIGDHLDMGIYYGHPLTSTDDTNKGNGRWSFSFTMRW